MASNGTDLSLSLDGPLARWLVTVTAFTQSLAFVCLSSVAFFLVKNVGTNAIMADRLHRIIFHVSSLVFVLCMAVSQS